MPESIDQIKRLQAIQEDIKSSMQADIDELKELSSDMLNVANSVLAYHKHLQEPFFPIVEKHKHIIHKYELFSKRT